jgi:hypothetical protein
MNFARYHVHFLAGALIVAGCAESRQLMPTPSLYTDTETTLFSELPPEFTSTKVELIYVTDREGIVRLKRTGIRRS